MNPIPRRDALKNIGIGVAALAAASPLFAADTPPETGPAQPESTVGFKDGKYILPPLPYAYNALEPHIDEATMKLHHDIHNAAYVKGANAATEALAAIAAGTGDAALISHWNGALSFNLSGHALHTLFWDSMSPKGAAPSGLLADDIKASFGSQEAFEKVFSATAASVQGSGWAILGLDSVSGRLIVISAEKHQNLTVQGITPLLAIDVWEHAYYLKYQNKRADYIKAFLAVADYTAAEKRLIKAIGA
jgi:Fe-Mn family superoxide dismutase